MANVVLVMGESGSGKSSSIRTLPPEETFIINVIDKALPFRGWKSKYKRLSSDGKEGNYYATDDPTLIKAVIGNISKNRNDIKTIIIDDYQYGMAYEAMRRATEKGYQKFTEIAHNAWSIIEKLKDSRYDLDCFIITHTEKDVDGSVKAKTIGKMMDNLLTFEGMFTVVLKTTVIEDRYCFLTNDPTKICTAKSPFGMFKEIYIDNDLLLVKKAMHEYDNEDVPM